ncbi:MAG: hypothetical protein RIC95_09515 [Vicingaceae bacterium]
MKTFLVTILSLLTFGNLHSQIEGSDKIYSEFLYEKVFSRFECALEDSCAMSFKEAVFLVENTYFNETLDRIQFEQQIHDLVVTVSSVVQAHNLIYEGNDYKEVEKYAAIFQVMCDTIAINYGDTIINHLPFTYDFDDIWGYKQWSNMFVSKLLNTRKGNCHSMPLLYKILADQIGTEAHLAIAPNHFYIKQYSQKSGWFNTELTSASFPIDAWYMATGYIHLDGIVNKLYMEALSEKQSLVLCLIDLAKGYQQKFGSKDGEFIQKCIDLGLKHFPNYINALLLKTEVLKVQFFEIMESNYAEYPKEVMHIPEAKSLFDEMELLAKKIHKMGYRRMPREMYLDWLASLREEREKYTNKKISNFKSRN